MGACLGRGRLIVGGVLAAPLAGYSHAIWPQRYLMIAWGALVSLLAVYQTARLL